MADAGMFRLLVPKSAATQTSVELIAASRVLAAKVAYCADIIDEERRIPAELAGEIGTIARFRGETALALYQGKA